MTRAAGHGPTAGHATHTYLCARCGEPLFAHDDRTEESTPSLPVFGRPLAHDRVEYGPGEGHGHTAEVRCRSCGATLGHMVDEGTARRHCIQGDALRRKAPG